MIPRIVCACVAMTLSVDYSSAAVRDVKGGAVSITFDDGFLLGLTILNVDSPVPPAEGFDIGMRVLDESDFAINVVDGQFHSFRDGVLVTEGGITVTAPGVPVPIDFDEFSLFRDAEHEPEEFYIFGHISLLEVFVNYGDFGAGKVSYDDNTGVLSITDINITIAREIAEDVFGSPVLIGTPLASARIDLIMSAPNGDADDDTDVDLQDFDQFIDCVTGPAGSISETLCRVFDFDDDGNVDVGDFGLLQERFTGTLYMLDILAEDESAVAIQVSPTDFFGQADGVTSFRRSFVPGEVVMLTAPSDTLLSAFVRWRVGDSDQLEGMNEFKLTMEDATTVTAVYQSVTSALSVTSVGVPRVSIAVSVADVFEMADGVTDFTRIYPDGTEISLVAPLEANDKFFERWTVGTTNGDLAANQTVVVMDDDVVASANYADIVILGGPDGASGCVGDLVVLSIAAVGNDLEYRWSRDDVEIPGATSDSLVIEELTLDDEGTYTVEVFNELASTVSGGAFVSVLPATPTIVASPLSANLCPGGGAFLFVLANGGDLSYQWFIDGESVPGATTAFFPINGATVDDSGDYTVEVSSLCGTLLSDPAVIDVSEDHCP
jgi:Divergent InlB B-repeat domain